MNVLLTGASGRVGSAIVEYLGDRSEYDFTYLDRTDRPDFEVVQADITDYESIRPAFDGQDAVIHLAANPNVDASFESVLENNIRGTYNVLEAAQDAEVERVVFASSYHTVALHELEVTDRWNDYAAMYESDLGLPIDHTVRPAPDSYYGASKLFGEHLGRRYVHPDSYPFDEDKPYPERFYAWRICAAGGSPENDHPYVGVEDSDLEPGSEAYENQVLGTKAKYFFREDIAHMADCMLQDESITFDVFYGLSDNESRWYDIEHAKAVLGYEPRHDADDWDGPPE